MLSVQINSNHSFPWKQGKTSRKSERYNQFRRPKQIAEIMRSKHTGSKPSGITYNPLRLPQHFRTENDTPALIRKDPPAYFYDPLPPLVRLPLLQTFIHVHRQLTRAWLGVGVGVGLGLAVQVVTAGHVSLILSGAYFVKAIRRAAFSSPSWFLGHVDGHRIVEWMALKVKARIIEVGPSYLGGGVWAPKPIITCFLCFLKLK